jgi:HK97 family phage major capsid protein
MFVEKTVEEIEKMSAEEMANYLVEKKEHEAGIREKEINDAIAKFKEENEAENKEKIDSLKSELSTLKDNLQETALRLKGMTERGNLKDTKVTIKEEIETNKDVLKAIATSKNGNKSTVLKALTNRVAVVDNEHALDLPDIGQLATRKLSMYDIFPKITISDSNTNGVVRYYDWDEATIARAAAMVAEGGTFPESTAKFKKYSIDVKKIGDSLPVTEEFFEDASMFASELQMFLMTNMKLVEDNQICNGDGTGNNLTGLYTSIDAYTPVASGITDASIYDLAVKVIEDITLDGGSKYTPDVLIARSAVINQMKLKKDANNNYVMPPFVSRDGQVVDGLLVIESNIAPANTLVVGDRRYGRIYERTGFEVSEDTVNEQFLEDAMTMKVRKRMLFLIRNADKGAFRKVTSVSAALTTLAS